MEIIPAIDIINGQCVRLTQGDYNEKTVYNENPLEIAKQFEAAGIRRLHIVDLDGARAGHSVNLKTVEKICRNTKLIIDFGGGIKNKENMKTAFDAGVHMITGGSMAVKNRAEFLECLSLFGADRIILGADCRNGNIAVSGWTEETELHVNSFIESYAKEGVYKVICTDISRDGMLTGPAIDLYKSIMKTNPVIELIASGGVGCFNDLVELKKAGLPAVIVGKAFYEGKISLGQLQTFDFI